jgi:hypothetical protein
MDLPQLCIDMVADAIISGAAVQLEAARDAASLVCAGNAQTKAIAMAVFRRLDPGFSFVPREAPVPIDVRSRKLVDLREEARSRHRLVRGSKADLARRIDQWDKSVWEWFMQGSVADRCCPVGKDARDLIVAEAYFAPQANSQTLLAASVRLYGLRAVVWHLESERKKEAYLVSNGGVDGVVDSCGSAEQALRQHRDKLPSAAETDLNLRARREKREKLIGSYVREVDRSDPAYASFVKCGAGGCARRVADDIEHRRFLEANPGLPPGKDASILAYVRRCGGVQGALAGLPFRVASKMAEQQTAWLAAMAIRKSLEEEGSFALAGMPIPERVSNEASWLARQARSSRTLLELSAEQVATITTNELALAAVSQLNTALAGSQRRCRHDTDHRFRTPVAPAELEERVSSFVGGVCRCGNFSNRSCISDKCGSCCHRRDCPAHGRTRRFR